ncbi:MAG: ATP-binding protein [Sphaerochaeta sp.]|nr:ATP-binding protein [Sphaerochaeta sp.]
MQHTLWKQVIFDQHEVIKRVKIIPREYTFEPQGNYVLTGLRRAGKSTLLYDQIRTLVSQGVSWEQIICINFEDERLAECTAADLNDILGVQAELSDKKGYFFFDEIQNIKGWEKFARRLADSKERTFITGSNAKMLSSEMETVLGGRFLSMHVYPFSFREYLTAVGVPFGEQMILQTKGSAAIRKAFASYLHVGGLPEVLSYQDKRAYLSSVYQKILLGDILARNGIRNPKALELMMKKRAESVKDVVSFSRLHHLLGEIGVEVSKDSLIEYTGYAEDSYLLFPLRNYISSFADREGNPKWYFSDNGLLSLFLVQKDPLLLENLVAVALSRRYPHDLFFFKSEKTGIDVDFYLPNEHTAIGVTYTLDGSTDDREIRNLVALAKSLGDLKRLVLLTYEEERDLGHRRYPYRSAAGVEVVVGRGK